MTILDLRHTVVTLAYRAAKVLRDAPEDFGDYRPAPGARSAGEILAHLGDLFDRALSQVRGATVWFNSQPQAWSADVDRFFAALTLVDGCLAANADLSVTPEKLFQGPIADALTHVGQIDMLRRLAGAQIRGEN